MPDLAVSIVIPTYDRAPILPRAIESARAQLRPGDEIVVVDDGSTDGTRALLATYDAPVRPVFTPNRGAGAARNAGIAEARNPLVAFLDSDDEWMPGSLEARRRLLEARADVLFCFSNFAITHPDGRTAAAYLRHWHEDRRPWTEILGPGERLGVLAGPDVPFADTVVHVGDLYMAEMSANYVLTSSLLVRRKEAGAALFFDPDLANGEDWVCFGLVARCGQGAYFDADMAWQHGDSTQRISCAAEVSITAGRIGVLEAVWGRDEAFLAEHRTAYEAELAAAHVRHARALLAAGRSREARTVLDGLDHAPRSFRALAALPQPVLGTALRARRLLRRIRGADQRAAGAGAADLQHAADESHTAHANR